jgi:hypothetical protein
MFIARAEAAETVFAVAAATVSWKALVQDIPRHVEENKPRPFVEGLLEGA